jgi:signal transduction histidine kinase
LGLGLAIAKRLVELHGGMLAIEGEKGAGATVTAKFPKTKPA